ncbi:UNVERIFIED_CONTAM: hypothetical protein Sindi_0662100 [Sesamum indicum]
MVATVATLALNEHLLGACWGLQELSLGVSKECLESPKGLELDGWRMSRMAYIGHKRGQEVPFDMQDCGQTHGGRLASWGWPRECAKVCMPKALANMGILDRRANGHVVPRREAFRYCASELQCRRHAANSW